MSCRPKQQQTIIQNVPGTGRQLLVTGTPAFNDKGELFLIVANERDITDLNTLHEHLDQARKAQEKVQRELDTLTMLELTQGGVVAESKAMRQVADYLPQAFTAGSHQHPFAWRIRHGQRAYWQNSSIKAVREKTSPSSRSTARLFRIRSLKRNFSVMKKELLQALWKADGSA